MPGHPCPESLCCAKVDVVTWSNRFRLSAQKAVLQWAGGFDADYVAFYEDDPYSSEETLVYLGQHLETSLDCGIIYYIANHATETLDAFQRSLITGETIDLGNSGPDYEKSILWSAPLGMLYGEGLASIVNPCGTWVGNGISSWRSNGGLFCTAGECYDFDPGDGRVIQIRDREDGAILSQGRYITPPLTPPEEYVPDPRATALMPTGPTSGIYVAETENGTFDIIAGEVTFTPRSRHGGRSQLGNHLFAQGGTVYLATEHDDAEGLAVWTDADTDYEPTLGSSLSYRFGKLYAMNVDFGSGGSLSGWAMERDPLGSPFNATGDADLSGICTDRMMQFAYVVRDFYDGGDPTIDILPDVCGDTDGDATYCDCDYIEENDCLRTDLSMNASAYDDLFCMTGLSPCNSVDISGWEAFATCWSIKAMACLVCCNGEFEDSISSVEIEVSGTGLVEYIPCDTVPEELGACYLMGLTEDFEDTSGVIQWELGIVHWAISAYEGEKSIKVKMTATTANGCAKTEEITLNTPWPVDP